jgi:hypothetical protein
MVEHTTTSLINIFIIHQLPVMNLTSIHPVTSELENAAVDVTSNAALDHSNVSDGCEFIDDGIRSKDQPLIVPEQGYQESVNRIL